MPINDMKTLKSTDLFLRYAVFVLIGMVGLAQMLACRGLYADGSGLFVSILEARSFASWETHRIINIILTEFPLVLALKLGLHNMAVLRYIFSSWILFCPLILWTIALGILFQSRLFWPFVGLFTFVHFSCAFFAIGEFNVCFALFALCLACILRPRPRTPALFTLLFIASGLLAFEYAASLFLGAFLCFLALREVRQSPTRNSTLYWLFLASFFGLSVFSGVLEIIFPRDTENFHAARNFDVLFVDRCFWLTFFGAGAAIAATYAGHKGPRYAFLILSIVMTAFLLVSLDTWFPFYSYSIRMYVAVALLLTGVTLYAARDHLITSTTGPLSAAPFFALLLISSLFDVNRSLAFGQYLDDFKTLVDARTGLIPFEYSGVRDLPGNDDYNRMWTSPLLSIVLRSSSKQAIILNPDNFHGYQLFDPLTRIPDFDRYYSKP